MAPASPSRFLRALTSTPSATAGCATEASGRAGENIAGLAELLDEAARSATQISASAGQQAAGMTQIHQAMKTIDETSRQSLAATRQSETATQRLSELGRELAALLVASRSSGD